MRPGTRGVSGPCSAIVLVRRAFPKHQFNARPRGMLLLARRPMRGLCASRAARPDQVIASLPKFRPPRAGRGAPETRRTVAFMRAVFASGTPSFGSCAGLQVATVAAGGTVRPNLRGYEAAFARRITATERGRSHPLLAGCRDCQAASWPID
ncbi:gamma-glutamyl-gamma-aminobutyrate hydrolase family protein [Methylobacterium sp. UNC378MF]|uniref:gamma-glutamyl-gamma-aminobutyrate hydrolase family protein n=1 Tax=Methylobacterium sp. UNC378MF TaxID=1502748 RepID=UPI00329836BA